MSQQACYMLHVCSTIQHSVFRSLRQLDANLIEEEPYNRLA